VDFSTKRNGEIIFLPMTSEPDTFFVGTGINRVRLH
jgi:hypothetical protein